MRLNNRGITLIEVIVTVAIIGLALIPTMDIFVAGKRNSSVAGGETTAVNLAQEKLEDALNSDFNSLVSGTGNFGAGFPGYHYEIESVADSSYLKRITVTVFYNIAGGVAREVTVSTYRAKR